MKGGGSVRGRRRRNIYENTKQVRAECTIEWIRSNEVYLKKGFFDNDSRKKKTVFW